MPFLFVDRRSYIVNRKKKNMTDEPLTINYQRAFSIIEVLLSVFIIIILGAILLVATGSLTQTHRSNLQTIASKIASKKIEDLRNIPFVSLPPTGSFSDPNLSKLPLGAANLTVSNYQSSAQIKQINVVVSWQINGLNGQVTQDTLIYQNGI